jgi:anthranilate phosphoribosyltransferase
MSSLQDIAPLLEKLSYGERLSAKEAHKAFRIIGDNDVESYHYLAITFGLMTRGPTADELYGVCLDRADRVKNIPVNAQPGNLIDVSGGGGGEIETPNISTMASVILAAGGVSVAKQSAPAVTSSCGSRDILDNVGVEIPVEDGDLQKVKACLEQIKILPYYYSAYADKGFENFLEWRETVKDIGLKYLTPWHLVSFVYSPVDIKNRVYGLFTEEYLRPVANLFKRFDYDKALVVNGVDGLDEISNVGKTKVCELADGSIEEYTLNPKDFGVSIAKPKDIESKNRKQNLADFIEILYGQRQDSKRDLVAMNAGAGFYTMEEATSLKNGTQKAIKLVENGKASDKLEELVSFHDGTEQLQEIKEEILD